MNPVRTTVLVGFPPNGPVDIVARLTARMLSTEMREPFDVQNLAGHGGNDAAAAAAAAAPDGYTLLMCAPANAINTILFPDLPFDFQRDLVAVASVCSVPLVMEVHPSVSAESAMEFLALAKQHPGRLRIAFAGIGTPQHIGIELFCLMTGVDLTLVAYAGSAPALVDLLAGRVDAMFDPAPSSIEHVRAGRLRALAVTGAARLDSLTDVPSMSEFVPGYVAGSWFGLCAPRGTPVDRIDAINRATNAALREASVRQQLTTLGAVPMPGLPRDFARFMAAETTTYARVIADAGIAARLQC